MQRSEAPAGLAVTVLDKRPGRRSAAEPPAPGSGLRTWTPSAYARNSGDWGALDGLLGCRPRTLASPTSVRVDVPDPGPAVTLA